ncbi:hypothetical protein [Actinoplanes philippinensis]|uniref:hypothetical protein n=1 Tax=Actinoplanes philippinensis TaxID=35752 RepID=UPI0033C12874
MLNGIADALHARVFVDDMSAFVGRPAAVAFVLIGWLAGAAWGLRRGSVIAYRLRLAAMVLPMMLLTSGSVFVQSRTKGYMIGFSGESTDVMELAERADNWSDLAYVANRSLGTAVLGLAAVTVATLLSRAVRRFFTAPTGPAEPMWQARDRDMVTRG